MLHAHYGAMESHGSPILLTLTIGLTALLYLRGWYGLRATPSKASDWRAVSFLVGLFSVWIALASPIAGLDHELLTAHMLQHLLLMTVAPPLLWLGAPVMVFASGLPPKFVEGTIRPVFAWPAVQRLARVVTEPAFCWLAAAMVLMVWHIPAAFTLALHSEPWHIIEQATFFAAGLLFWRPVIQPWPSLSRWPEWSILLYLFFATVPCDILSGLLVFYERVVYPDYLSSSHLFNLSALEDQQCAGAVMWTAVTVIYLVVGTIFAARLLSPQISHKGEHVIPQPNPSGLEVA